MVPMSRRVYLWSAWAFLASVVVQVFFIGLYLFADFDLTLHFLGALIVTVVALVVLIVTLVARLDNRSKRWAAALFVMTIVQGSLPGFKEFVPFVAALHPVNALVLFWLGLVILRDAQRNAREAASMPPTDGAMPAEATSST